ncbi:competence type IV pilus minor pilin ComGD [Lentibacillus saliphilus]|uniref:competence type IV pilus minor pilin ComGD n=1 Tax=Lentibacillus saliphilus TaxID=2737028 RepID=UPI001C305DC7|nr:competence type IV pilus minor pilin ComGD [Lentibacillus saliphilus]
MTPNQTQRGFTLLEMLIVLAIFSIILLLIPPIHIERLHIQQEEQFFSVLQSDLLYTQVLASTHPEHLVRLTFIASDQKYILVMGSNIILERSLPGDWIDHNHEIVFAKSGVVKQPASFVLTTPSNSYKIVFPFGKGRARIEKL